MSIEQKIKSLKARRANILGRVKVLTNQMEAQFLLDEKKGGVPLMERIKSFSGRYYAKAGPLLKQAKEYQRAIELLR